MSKTGLSPQKNSEQKTERANPGKNGNALRVGNPGNKGGGRPPSEFKDWLSGVLADPTARAVFEAHIKSGNMKAWSIAAEYSATKPPQQHKVDATVTFKATKE